MDKTSTALSCRKLHEDNARGLGLVHPLSQQDDIFGCEKVNRIICSPKKQVIQDRLFQQSSLGRRNGKMWPDLALPKHGHPFCTADGCRILCNGCCNLMTGYQIYPLFTRRCHIGYKVDFYLKTKLLNITCLIA